jgi:predicted Rossmann fold flavoprotein
VTNPSFDAIILGAGAAGLMCAMTAGARGRRVLLLDHAEKVGKKILISGGGRCNFTNIGCAPENFISGNPHFCKSALARYTQFDFIDLVEKHGIAWHEKTLGQLFCDDSARRIVAMLVAECEAVGVDIRVAHKVTDVSRADRFRVDTDKGSFAAPSLVLATGGLSIPKMGATGLAHDLAKRFGLPLRDIRPGLVPLTVGAEDLALMRPLSGVSVDCVALGGGKAFRENMLLTHRGLSGPAILQVSSYWRQGEAITLNLSPDRSIADYLCEVKRERAKIEPQTALGGILPARLATAVAEADLPKRRIGELPDTLLRGVGDRLNAWTLTPSGSEGYAKAEVTIGGIDTDALSSKDMSARAVPGLYAIGEAVDVTGWLGGYNFQWAWASGHAAGSAIA